MVAAKHHACLSAGRHTAWRGHPQTTPGDQGQGSSRDVIRPAQKCFSSPWDGVVTTSRALAMALLSQPTHHAWMIGFVETTLASMTICPMHVHHCHSPTSPTLAAVCVKRVVRKGATMDWVRASSKLYRPPTAAGSCSSATFRAAAAAAVAAPEVLQCPCCGDPQHMQPQAYGKHEAGSRKESGSACIWDGGPLQQLQLLQHYITPCCNQLLPSSTCSPKLGNLHWCREDDSIYTHSPVTCACLLPAQYQLAGPLLAPSLSKPSAASPWG